MIIVSMYTCSYMLEFVFEKRTMFFCITFTVAACLRDLRNEAVVFLAGIVRHITSVAVVQQSCKLKYMD